MTAWYVTPEGRDRYVTVLTHHELVLTWQGLRLLIGALEREGAPPAGHLPRAAMLEDIHLLLDQLDPAKVRGDWLREHDGPKPWPPEPP